MNSRLQRLHRSEHFQRSIRELHALHAGFSRAVNTGVAILREIFDESAYNRFLIRNQLRSSQDTYAAFRREYEVSRARRPKCC